MYLSKSSKDYKDMAEKYHHISQLMTMHSNLMNCDYEEPYYRWINWMPDEALEEDFVDIVEDGEFYQYRDFFFNIANDLEDEKEYITLIKGIDLI